MSLFHGEGRWEYIATDGTVMSLFGFLAEENAVVGR